MKVRWTILVLALFATGNILFQGIPAQASEGDFEFRGAIQTLPNGTGFIGDWMVGGRTVHVKAATKLKQSDGPIAVGATVKVEGLVH